MSGEDVWASDLGALEEGVEITCDGDTVPRWVGRVAPAVARSVVDSDLGRCGHGRLDPFGHHRAGLAQAGLEDHRRAASTRATDVELAPAGVDDLADRDRVLELLRASCIASPWSCPPVRSASRRLRKGTDDERCAADR